MKLVARYANISDMYKLEKAGSIAFFPSVTGEVQSIQPLELERLYGNKLLTAATFLCQTPGNDPNTMNILLNMFGDPALPTDRAPQYTKAITTIVQHPTTPAKAIMGLTDVDLKDLSQIHQLCQRSHLLHDVLTSHYYPGYLAARYAQGFYRDLTDNPQYLDDVITGNPRAPKRLEVHATDAQCNYRCAMCLWDVQGRGKYPSSESTRLLSVEDWKHVLKEAKDMGTEIAIFSGGGEPLLRGNAGRIMDYAKQIGLSTMVYTNGSSLEDLPFDGELYQALLSSDWLRVSLHATTDKRYADLVGLAESAEPLSKVIRGMQRLIQDRDQLGKPLKIGLGFVTQHKNYDQVGEVAQLARDMGVDFLNLREDCIAITQQLSPEEREHLYRELALIRLGHDEGYFGKMNIDFADSMIGSMNGWLRNPHIETSNDCRVHLYRSAIDPYGMVGVCDLAAEPYFAHKDLTLGFVTPTNGYKSVIEGAANKHFDARLCTHCMPGQQAINGLWYKTIEDNKLGLGPEMQPLFFHDNRTVKKQKELYQGGEIFVNNKNA